MLYAVYWELRGGSRRDTAPLQDYGINLKGLISQPDSLRGPFLRWGFIPSKSKTIGDMKAILENNSKPVTLTYQLDLLSSGSSNYFMDLLVKRRMLSIIYITRF